MIAHQDIPVYTNLNDVFGSLGASLQNIERWNGLAEEFERRYGTKPSYIARAPGRVNLIGEHIDYALFGVLPAAVEPDILIACGPSSHPHPPQAPGTVVADNLHQKYSRQVFTPSATSTKLGSSKAAVDVAADEDAHAEEWNLDINTKELRWESYVKAGYYVESFCPHIIALNSECLRLTYLRYWYFDMQGVLEHYFPPTVSGSPNPAKPVPVELLVTGSVPAGSGLSSSAAMVVASTLAFLAVNGKLNDKLGDSFTNLNSLTKGQLVEMAMENEKRVGQCFVLEATSIHESDMRVAGVNDIGVNSGGMDQAASVMSDPASALYISFYPELQASPVPIPPRVVFVCANSLVVSDKAVTAKRCYNLRVVETLAAARILARSLGVQVGEKERITLRHVVGRYLGEVVSSGQTLDAERLAEALREVLPKLDILKPGAHRDDADTRVRSGVTLQEMIEMSGLDPDVFHEVYLSWIEVEADFFELYNRAKHVLSEALRVLEFRQVCLSSAAEGKAASSPNVNNGGYQEKLGKLMDESQESCAKLFDCSCPELDRLTSLARTAGAFGSRLTGAGWGGCTVSLVAEDQVDGFIRKIKEEYPPYKGLDEARLNEAIFATRPGRGACATFSPSGWHGSVTDLLFASLTVLKL
ncbi:hypothetical protein MD484_g3076, partial [Candolleomyces efflorescens]